VNDPALEDRVARIETLIEKLVIIARDHPLGRMVLKKLGLS